MKVTLKKLHELYPDCKIICVEECFLRLNPNDPDSQTMRWVSILPDGTDVRDPDMYYKFGLNFVVAMCAQKGATQISFRILDSNKEYGYPDFYITELNEK